MTLRVLRAALALVPLVLTTACPQAPPRATPPPANRSGIAVGQTTAGVLTQDAPTFADGSHYRAYPFNGRGGDTITADVESVDFDANVILTDGHGNRLIGNDDSGGNCCRETERTASTSTRARPPRSGLTGWRCGGEAAWPFPTRRAAGSGA